MDVLVLVFRGEPLRDFVLDEQPLELGRAAGCDIVVHDSGVGERHWLIARDGGAITVHDLRTGERRALPTGHEVPVGMHHGLLRVRDLTKPPPPEQARTEPLRRGLVALGQLSVLVGSGPDARRVALGSRPLTVGSSERVDLTLTDRAVSGLHCRFEPGRDGVYVRDLASRNGTCVDGVAVGLARVHAGSRVKVGRTTLRLVPRGEPGDARLEGLVASSAAMREVLATVERYARLRWPVLVTGESGVGKEGVARALHRRGPRRDGPFVAVNAGGMPATLVESELFGHERGAFTGAVGSRRGVFEQADGGTLFLDEIGELPLELQARLLRVLETWEVRRLGAEGAVRVDVRLVCATHRDLSRMVLEGTFRQDLYYRVAQLGLDIPPLRRRRDDIEALGRHFLREIAEQVGPRRLTREALLLLHAYGWPGNVRELRNACRRAAAGSPSPWIDADDVRRVLEAMGAAPPPDPTSLGEVLEAHGGNLTAAARSLGIPRSTLRDRLRRAEGQP